MSFGWNYKFQEHMHLPSPCPTRKALCVFLYSRLALLGHDLQSEVYSTCATRVRYPQSPTAVDLWLFALLSSRDTCLRALGRLYLHHSDPGSPRSEHNPQYNILQTCGVWVNYVGSETRSFRALFHRITWVLLLGPGDDTVSILLF